tara:strand:+ start:1364 stop:1939 length:576 start_codon:yes stop_codon:yes gene_type:complete
MIIIIDNYDSFTYNLVQYIGSINSKIEVFKNDQITIDDLKNKNPNGIVISPGPGRPEDAGISIDIIKKLGKHIPILGICLGHQAIAIAFNGSVDSAGEIMHGKTSIIKHTDSLIFKGIPKKFIATRYHSLIVLNKNLPNDLKVTSMTVNNLIMSYEHKKFPIFGIQFHPESIATENGMKIIKNFLDIVYKN